MAKDAGAALTRLGVALQTEGHIAQDGGFGTRDVDEGWTRQYTWETARPVPLLPHTSREALWPSEQARRQDRQQQLTQLRALRHVACDCWWMARRWCSLTDDGRAAHYNALARGLHATGLLGGTAPVEARQWPPVGAGYPRGSRQRTDRPRGLAVVSGHRAHGCVPKRRDTAPGSHLILLRHGRLPDTSAPLAMDVDATTAWRATDAGVATCPVAHVEATPEDQERAWHLLATR